MDEWLAGYNSYPKRSLVINSHLQYSILSGVHFVWQGEIQGVWDLKVSYTVFKVKRASWKKMISKVRQPGKGVWVQ